MSKRAEDPLVADIRSALMPGRFVRWNEVSGMVSNLDRVQGRVEALVKAGEAKRAVGLYEIFLSGVYAKIEEADDECDLANLFHRLICGWIEARQAAGLSAKETVSQLLGWMKNDDFGFCNDIEKHAIKVLNPEGGRLLISHFQGLVEKALPTRGEGSTRPMFEYENDLRLPAMSLKGIYESLGDASSYASLCEGLGFSPRDCEHLAKMEITKKRWSKALEWVEKGITLKMQRDWHNEDDYELVQLKPEILRHLGRKDDALALAWVDFEKDPNEFAYEQLMRFVPKKEKAAWRERAMEAADKADLGDFISLCVKVKAWERLAQRVHLAKPGELEAQSHYCTEPAAEGLTKNDPLAAAKLYRALGLRIVNAGKSKYYREALEHFGKARDLYCAAGQPAEWGAVVQFVRAAHSRKSGFVSAFEKIVSGKSGRVPSFAEAAQERWKRLTA
jgi:tetratricopeptide (TPR) repeat protein